MASHTWALEPDSKSVTVVKGGYSRYLAIRQEAQGSASNNTAEHSPKKGARIREQSRAEKRAAEKKSRQIAELESIIAATETELAELAQKLEAASQSQDVTQLQILGQNYQTAEAKLDELIAQWAELEAA